MVIDSKKLCVLLILFAFLSLAIAIADNSQLSASDNSSAGNSNTVLVNIDNVHLQEVLQNTTPTEMTQNDNSSAGNSNTVLVNIDNVNYTQPAQNNSPENNDSVLIGLDNITLQNYSQIPASSNGEGSVNAGKSNSSMLVNLDDISAQNQTENQTQNESNNQSLNTCTLFKDGKIMLEMPGDGCESIHKDDVPFIINNSLIIASKVYSEIHIATPFVVYSDISQPTSEAPRLFWILENVTNDVTDDPSFDVKFYTDDEGRYNRISWIVPHLSDQYFEIVVNLSVSGSNSTSNNTLDINTINPLNNSKVDNPVQFLFNISYSALNNLSCSLGLNSISFIINATQNNFTRNLQNGNYSWNFSCFDVNTGQNKTVYGSFYVNSSFSENVLNPIAIAGEDVNLSLNAQGNVLISLKKPNGSFWNYNAAGPYPETFTISKNLLNAAGMYYLNITSTYFANPVSIQDNFSVTTFSFNLSKTILQQGANFSFSIDISSPLNILWATVEYNDTNAFSSVINQKEYHNSLTHSYSYAGNYTVKASAMIGSRPYVISQNISVNSSSDTQLPDINLISPDDNEQLTPGNINFIYSASDNVLLNNCTLELYNNTGNFGVLLYNLTTIANTQNLQNISTILSLGDGNYTWYVSCFDNSSNYHEESRQFEISDDNFTIIQLAANLSNYSTDYLHKAEIQGLLDSINNFYSNQINLSQDEKELSDDLKVTDTLDADKKLLLQMQLDFSGNLNSITDAAKKAARQQELEQELADIETNAITSIKVDSHYDFAKNSISDSLQDIVKSYVSSENLVLSSSQIKQLADENKYLQNNLSYSVNVKQAEIGTNESTNKITFVTIKLSLKDNDSMILESIPKTLAENASEVHFISQNTVVNRDPLFKVEPENDKINYYVDGFVDFKKFEDTDTVLFKEFAVSSSLGISGFAVAVYDNINISNFSIYFFIVILAVFIVYIFIVAVGKIRVARWKEDDNFERLYRLLREAKRHIKFKNIERARQNYAEMQTIYPLIPDECKQFAFKNIKQVILAIDKSDAFNLMREYLSCRREGRKEDAAIAYNKLQAIYKRLPERYREKLFKRIND